MLGQCWTKGKVSEWKLCQSRIGCRVQVVPPSLKNKLRGRDIFIFFPLSSCIDSTSACRRRKNDSVSSAAFYMHFGYRALNHSTLAAIVTARSHIELAKSGAVPLIYCCVDCAWPLPHHSALSCSSVLTLSNHQHLFSARGRYPASAIVHQTRLWDGILPIGLPPSVLGSEGRVWLINIARHVNVLLIDSWTIVSMSQKDGRAIVACCWPSSMFIQ